MTTTPGDYFRDPWAYLADVLPPPKVVLQRGPKMDKAARKLRERDRMRRRRAEHAQAKA